MNIIVDTRMVKKELHGIARYAYELVNNLSEYPDLRFYLLTNDEAQSRRLFRTSENISYVRMKSKFLSPKEQLELPIVLSKFGRECIFHSPSFSSSPFLRMKSIMTIHDLNHIRFPEFYTPLHKYYYNYIVKPAARKCKKILTVSNFSKEELLKWLKCEEEKIVVTYNGIDRGFKRVTDQLSLREIRDKYKLPDRFILYIGNQKPHKNVKTLVKAMSLVQEGTALVINGKLNDEMSALLKEHKIQNRVHFIGFAADEDLAALYTLAEVFVFPSLYEGFGLPPLEAMACGCPAIVANTSSLPEVTGKGALTFEALDYKALANTINTLQNDPNIKNNLIEKGIKQAELFKWKETARSTYNIYRELQEGENY